LLNRQLVQLSKCLHLCIQSHLTGRKALLASHPYQKLAIDERVKRILRDTPLFDGHNDLPQQPRAVTHDKIYDQLKFDFEKDFERGMTDIPRLRDGDLIPPLSPNTQFVRLEASSVEANSL
jgi:hypothetical protein